MIVSGVSVPDDVGEGLSCALDGELANFKESVISHRTHSIMCGGNELSPHCAHEI